MYSHANTFRTPKAQATLQKLSDLLVELGSASNKDLATATGLCRNTVGTYLRHMEDIGAAVCESDAVHSFKGSAPAMWRAGSGAVITDESDDLPRKVVVRQAGEWEPLTVRLGLEWLLHGAQVAA